VRETMDILSSKKTMLFEFVRLSSDKIIINRITKTYNIINY